jgi:hypothetical protein
VLQRSLSLIVYLSSLQVLYNTICHTKYTARLSLSLPCGKGEEFGSVNYGLWMDNNSECPANEILAVSGWCKLLLFTTIIGILELKKISNTNSIYTCIARQNSTATYTDNVIVCKQGTLTTTRFASLMNARDGSIFSWKRSLLWRFLQQDTRAISKVKRARWTSRSWKLAHSSKAMLRSIFNNQACCKSSRKKRNQGLLIPSVCWSPAKEA